MFPYVDVGSPRRNKKILDAMIRGQVIFGREMRSLMQAKVENSSTFIEIETLPLTLTLHLLPR